MTSVDILGDFRRACALLTRLPIHADFSKTGSTTWAWAFPVVGLVVGGIAVAAATGLMALGLGMAAVAIGLVIQVMVTGAMHEDGLADTADGFWGGWTPARRLEIMKDSHIGTYGVIALVLAFLWRWALWGVLLGVAPLALVATAALSRAPLPALMAALPNARDTGLSHTTGRPPRATAAISGVIATLIALGCVGPLATVIGLAVVALVAITVGMLTKSKIGGQTGDVLGAAQVVAELLCLTAFAVIFTQ